MSKSKIYYFTVEYMDISFTDYFGNIRGARRVAKEYANAIDNEVFINCGEDIIESVYPDR